MVPAYTKVPTITRVVSGSNLYQSLKMQNSTAADVSSPRELRIPVPWGHIAAKSWGSAKGLPVLCLHGFLDNAGSFDRLAPLLSSSLNVVAVDFSGHGLSSFLPPGMNYHFVDMLTDVRRIADHMEWKEFSIIGHSKGAGVASLFASINPQRVKKLVLLDGIIPMPQLPAQQPTKTQVAIEQMFRLEKTEQNAAPTSSTTDQALQRLMAALDGKILESSAKILLRRGTMPVGENMVKYTRDPRIRLPSLLGFTPDVLQAFISGLRCELLVFLVKGGIFQNDRVYELLKVCEKNCSKYQYHEVEGNHHIHLDNPEKISKTIEAFLL